jgi:hypothetical protein
VCGFLLVGWLVGWSDDFLDGWVEAGRHGARVGASWDRHLARLKWRDLTHPSRLFCVFSLYEWKERVGVVMVLVYGVEEGPAHADSDSEAEEGETRNAYSRESYDLCNSSLQITNHLQSVWPGS